MGYSIMSVARSIQMWRARG